MTSTNDSSSFLPIGSMESAASKKFNAETLVIQRVGAEPIVVFKPLTTDFIDLDTTDTVNQAKSLFSSLPPTAEFTIGRLLPTFSSSIQESSSGSFSKEFTTNLLSKPSFEQNFEPGERRETRNRSFLPNHVMDHIDDVSEEPALIDQDDFMNQNGFGSMDCQLSVTEEPTTCEPTSITETGLLTIKGNNSLFCNDTEQCAASPDHSALIRVFQSACSPVPTHQSPWINNGASENAPAPESIASSPPQQVLPKKKPTRRLDHQQVRRNSLRRTEELAAINRKHSRHQSQQQKRRNQHMRLQKVAHSNAELSVEQKAMKDFPGIPAKKAMEAYNLREEARKARALEPEWVFDEQRWIMKDFEAEQPYDHEEVDRWIKEEDENRGLDGAGNVDAEEEWLGMAEGGFGEIEDLEDFEMGWIEEDLDFSISSLAITPPHD